MGIGMVVLGVAILVSILVFGVIVSAVQVVPTADEPLSWVVFAAITIFILGTIALSILALIRGF